MAQDPLATVAAWLTPASADVTDPVIALIAERERLDHLYTRNQDTIDQLEATLPEVVTCGKVPVRLPYGAFWFRTEKDLESSINCHLKLVAAFTVDGRRPAFTPDPSDSPEMRDTLKSFAAICDAVASGENTWPERAREEFRARKARIAELREDAGLAALYRKGHELGSQIDEVDDQIWRSQATSFAGLVGQLELWRSNYGEFDDEQGDKNKLDTIIVGVKALVPEPAQTKRKEVADHIFALIAEEK